MVPEECREFFLWEPMEKAKPWPRWKKPSPINLRGAQAEIMKLDVISRRTIEIYVNESLLEEDAVIDFTKRGHMTAILESALGQAQTDEEVDAVMAAGQAYLRNWHLGRDGFRSRGEHEVACNVKTADMLSRESFLFPSGPEDHAQEDGGAVVAVVAEPVGSGGAAEANFGGPPDRGGASQARADSAPAAWPPTHAGIGT
eukprot:867756-Rhodomonas_salina.2